MSSRYCTFCGSEVAYGESHCMECGKKLPDAPPPTLPTIKRPDLPESQDQETLTGQPPVMYPVNPYQENQQKEQIPPQNQSQSFGRFGTNQSGQYPPGSYPPVRQQFPSQPFVIYLLGVLFGKVDSLKMEFQANRAKNSILLLILMLIVNYILYSALFSIFPFAISPEFLSDLLNQSLFSQDLGTEIGNQSFQQVFAISGLVTFIIGNIILGTLAFSFLFNTNRLPSPYKKAFIISVASLTPIIALEIVRVIVETMFVQGTGGQTIFLINNSEALAEYLGIIFNSNFAYNPNLRVILLSIRMAWTAILVRNLFVGAGIMKQKIFAYTALFTLFAGGGFDLLNQVFFIFV